MNELSSRVAEDNKWQLIQDVQKAYLEYKNISKVARIYGIAKTTAKKYLTITECPEHPLKNKPYYGKLNEYMDKIIDMYNSGKTYREIFETIRELGYTGSDSNIRMYFAKIKRRENTVVNISAKIERQTLISLLYKEIDKVKNITSEIFDKVIELYPEVGKIFDIIKEFKDIMFSKKSKKLNGWIKKVRKLNIPEFNSFINGIERDIEAVKNGIKYDFNNGLAEGCVNKIKVIKRIMYGRCSFDLLKQKVLLQNMENT